MTDRRSEESLTKELPDGIVEKFKILSTTGRSDETCLLDTNGDLISPTESIKNRLSTEKKVPYDMEKSGKSLPEVEKTKCSIRPSSSQKLER